MFKWYREWMESSMEQFKRDNPPIEILTPLGHDWDIAFLTVDNYERSFTTYSNIGRNSYQSYMKIQYSGKVVTLGDEDSYECLVDGKIKWIKKSLISFPKTL